ncbi:cytochrome P450 315a1, mitochondrial [Toxorhynchites rutilus septentrionalis]|uniref:cytochrome P450 315a1, mitochondrial n=1 Tax=Toxorhynchites rutilus septentrionalis TaxID=329112 RepID=UPI00247A808E|nr:cytochrome P450 315a1, mitochondrial [Toxorhynchites rutilus septentrionalis]
MCACMKTLRSHVKFVSNAACLESRSFESIPGPPRIPLIGSLNDIIHLGNPKKLHLTISKLHETYGSIVRLKISDTNAIFIKDPAMMRNVFAHEGKYPKHPLPPAWTYFNNKHNCKRGLFFMDDEEWFIYRKLLNRPLMRDTSWMVEPIKRVCDKTAKNLFEAEGASRGSVTVDNIEAILYKWSIEVILSLMLGSSYNQGNVDKLDDLIDRFSQIVYQIFLYSSKLMVIPPALADRLQLDAWKSFERIVPETLDIANGIIDIALDEIKRSDGLLSELQNCIHSREIIKRIFADFIIAAGDTTSFATLWCLYLLAENQKIQSHIRSSIKDDYQESPLVRGAIKETLRLFPIAPFIGRILEKDAKIGCYNIPQHTLALLSLYSAGRDSKNFHSPHEFLPQRWLRGDDNRQLFSPFNANASLPFAIGSRSCIGQKVAQYQMHFLISKILKYYQVSVLNKGQVDAELKMVTVPNANIRLVFETIAE